MRRCIHALIRCGTRDATLPGELATIVLLSGFLFAMSAANAQDPVLRGVEVRSFLGEPLNLRIALAASTEIASSAVCQSVIDADQRESALRSSDLILTMVELRDARYLQVRSRRVFSEPVARFSLRIGCPGEPVVDREFTALIDPPPFTVLPVSPVPTTATVAIDGPSTPSTPVKSSSPAVRSRIVVPASGTWSVYEGDTVTKLAKGIHPRNRARQRQYIAVLRELNPHIADIADDAPLAAGTRLALPDLLTLSGILPRVAVVTPPPPITTAAATRTPAAEKPAARAAPKVATRPFAPTVAPAPAKHNERKATPTAAPKATPPTAKVEPAKPASVAKASPRGEGFQLRLSGSEMDLSRSRNVTEDQRRLLREKQLMLDADDQVAALLSLKNTVKQLEQRLNEMQLKLAATPVMPTSVSMPPAPSTASLPTPVAVSTAAPALKTPTATSAPAAAPAGDATPAPAAAPAIVAVAPPPTPAPESPAPEKRAEPATLALEKPVPPESSFADTLAGYLPSPLVAGGMVAALLALVAAWLWSRRNRKSEIRLDSVMPGATGGSVAPAEPPPVEAALSHSAQTSARDAGFSDWVGQQADDGPATEPPVSESFMQTSRNVANIDADVAGEFAATKTRVSADHSQVDAPVIFDDTPARFEVDARPATTVDFLVGMDEKLPEDRVRRLQYMYERYPELKTNTISIDDADGVINAARLYYEEADKGNGRDKASELLTFAVEERPQEIRFWLAQFEIFRLESMAAEFTALAGKFHVLFSHTTAWPMVRHIGHELDPGNPLFAAGGGPLLAGETRFDPIAENWLNAPMDFTSDALMSDLRLALLDDHSVSRADFESVTARLSATPVTA